MVSYVDIQAWEKEYGEIPAVCFFVARSSPDEMISTIMMP